ncbi:MAG: glycosyltransferase [bacterium]
MVVVILGGWKYLGRCLTALARQAGVSNVEIIVPCDESLADTPSLRSEFPGVHFLRVQGRRTYAELRALGIQKTRGAIVALTEDHCAPDLDWCARILEAHAGPHAAVGGVLEKGPDTVLNWAVYLCDFSRYMNPVTEGSAPYLTDCNLSYKRTALASIAPVWAHEFHETSVNWALQARGESLWLSPRIIVRQQRSLRFGAALRERYAFGRLFASTRVSAISSLKRVFYAGFSFMLPPLVLGRVASNVLRKRRCVAEFVRALPALMFLATAWAWGEFVGYLTGRPGTSLMPEVHRAGTGAQGSREATA